MKDTFTRLFEVLNYQLAPNKPNETITRDATLFDLGADSLDTVEIMMSLEDEFDIHIDDEDGEQWKTVGDILSYLKEHLRDFQP